MNVWRGVASCIFLSAAQSRVCKADANNEKIIVIKVLTES
ncbi:hypothetical protein UYSO10_2584 [Kosakonia radicincitans]|nr:hypothetical protein UYSO10_2584 [Kosakonia radicincitans]